MKNISLFIGSILLYVLSAQAQTAVSFGSTKLNLDGTGDITKLKNPQPIIGKVFYNFSDMPDTTKRDSLTQEMFELDFGKNASMFVSYSSKQMDSTMKKIIDEQMKNATVDANGQKHFNFKFSQPLSIPNNTTFSRDKFYTDAANVGTSLHIMNIGMTVFLIKDTAEKINWQILDSTKNIQGNLCQKAVGESHGRTYTAWFCSDIPYSLGPRRLNGLPGLILEAYDEKHEVNYMFDHIETVRDTSEVLGLPENGIDATPKEFAKAQEAFRKNPQMFFQSTTSQSQGKAGVVKVVQGIAPKGWKKPVNNNPIDLK